MIEKDSLVAIDRERLDRLSSGLFKPLDFPSNGGNLMSEGKDDNSPTSSPGSSPPRSSPLPHSAMGGFPPVPPPVSGTVLPPSLPPGVLFPPNFNLQRPPSDYLNLQLSEGHYSRSPSYNMVSPNDPTANACKIVDFHGEKIASFNIHGKTMLCLPQAFEIFLKNLVGGLHTVYTKCKRLDIHPLVCNVEQVRVLRGLGAIQPGVNRCKLIVDTDFEELMKDCNTSRPGRPPKRVTPITTFSAMPPAVQPPDFFSPPRSIPFPPPPHHAVSVTAGTGPGGLRSDLPPPPPPPPPFHPFMPFSSQSQLAAQSLLGRNMLPSPHMALHENMLEKYNNMLRQLHGFKAEEERLSGSSPPCSDMRSPALNLSYRSEEDTPVGGRTDSEDTNTEDRGLDEDRDEDMDEDGLMLSEDEGSSLDSLKKDEDGGEEGGKSSSMLQLMSHIQDLVKTALVNAKKEEMEATGKEAKEDGGLPNKDAAGEDHGEADSRSTGKAAEGDKDEPSLDQLRTKVDKARKLSEIYFKRFKKERKLRRKIQDQLELETMKKAKLEAALSALSYQTFLQLKEEKEVKN